MAGPGPTSSSSAMATLPAWPARPPTGSWTLARPTATSSASTGSTPIPTLAGDQAFAFIGSGAFTGTAGELRTFQGGTTTYLQGDTNGDGLADFLIRLDGLHTLGGGDFML